MNIRSLQQSDIPEIEAIFKLYWPDEEFRNNLLKRMKGILEHLEDEESYKFKFFVAENNNEIVGVAGMRMVPDHMKSYVTTSNPAELYIIAAKYKRQGIGTALHNVIINESRNSGYTELVMFSGETHQDAWVFHDNSDFKRAGSVITPNGEAGIIWRMEL
jgi:L-amino acid N-acyltransferase YncA